MNILKKIKTYRVAGGYIFSGLFKTAVHTLSGFIILRWLNPEELGTWQSFTVFVGYIQILTLGTTSGLNRELPFYMGKGETNLAIHKLKAGGYYTTVLSIGLMLIVVVTGFFLYLLKVFSIDLTIMFIFAFSTAALQIQTNFLGATFRSSHSFSKLTTIHFLNAGLYVILIPLIYFFNIWGYVAYQVVLAFLLYIGYYLYRPYKIKYAYNFKETIELIKVGLPIYFWGYLSQISRSIPRTMLVLFGNPTMVGLYAPAGSINAAMLNLPGYLNRYLFPRMSYNFGKTNNYKAVFNYTMKTAKILLPIMLIIGILLAVLIPPAFTQFFPKYINSILVAQITIFSGVFYSVNALFQSTLNSIKAFSAYKVIISIRFIYIIGFSALSWLIFDQLLLAVACGAVLAEFFNMFNYYYFLKKYSKKYKLKK